MAYPFIQIWGGGYSSLKRAAPNDGTDTLVLPQELQSSAVDVRPQDADWDWSEALSTDSIPSGYQNSDATPVLTQAFGDEWDWNESVDDEWQADNQLQAVVIARPLSEDWDWSETVDDEWATDQTLQSVVVVTSQTLNDDWDWGEFVSSDAFGGGYQQADNAAAAGPSQSSDVDWEWDALDGEDGWSNHFTNYDPLSDQAYELDWDWSEALEDDWATDQVTIANVAIVPDAIQQAFEEFSEDVNDDWWTEHVTVANVAVVTDPIQHTSAEWDWDEILFSDVVTSGYQQADNAVVANSDQQPQTDWDFDSDFGGESGWNNHYTAYDPETQTFDDPWDWDESCEFEWQDESGPVVANNAPVVSPIQHTSAEWDWDETVENEWQDYRDAGVVPDGPIVPVIPAPTGGGVPGRTLWNPYHPTGENEEQKRNRRMAQGIIARVKKPSADISKLSTQAARVSKALQQDAAWFDLQISLILAELQKRANDEALRAALMQAQNDALATRQLEETMLRAQALAAQARQQIEELDIVFMVIMLAAL